MHTQLKKLKEEQNALKLKISQLEHGKRNRSMIQNRKVENALNTYKKKLERLEKEIRDLKFLISLTFS